MSRWIKVQHARKAPGSCDSCKTQIEIGQGYLWSTFARGSRLVPLRHLRCLRSSCTPEDREVRSWRRHSPANTWTPKRREAALRHFIADACIQGRDDWSTVDLFKHYLDQPADQVLGPMPARVFTWTLRRLGYTVAREQGRNIVLGLSPRSECAEVHGAYVR